MHGWNVDVYRFCKIQLIDQREIKLNLRMLGYYDILYEYLRIITFIHIFREFCRDRFLLNRLQLVSNVHFLLISQLLRFINVRRDSFRR